MKFKLHLHQLRLQCIPKPSKTLRILIKQQNVILPSIQRTWILDKRIILNQHLSLDLHSQNPIQIDFIATGKDSSIMHIGKALIYLDTMQDRTSLLLSNTKNSAHLIFSSLAVHLIQKDDYSRDHSNSSQRSKKTQDSRLKNRITPQFTIRKNNRSEKRLVEQKNKKEITPRKNIPTPIDLRQNSLGKNLHKIQRRIAESKSRQSKQIKNLEHKKTQVRLNQIEDINRQLQLLKQSTLKPFYQVGVQTDLFLSQSTRKDKQLALDDKSYSEQLSINEHTSTLSNHNKVVQLQARLQEVNSLLINQRRQKQEVRLLLKKLQNKYQRAQQNKQRDCDKQQKLQQQNRMLRNKIERIFELTGDSISNNKTLQQITCLLQIQ